MKTRPSPFAASPIVRWLEGFAGPLARPNRQARRRSLQRHQGETLESRVVMSATAVANLVRSATAPAVAALPVAGVLPQSSTSNAVPSRSAAVAVATVVADPNDQISEAVNMGTITAARTEFGTIDAPTDVDMFRVTVTAGQRLSFDVDVTGQFDSYIRLFNASGTQLASNDDGAAPGESGSLESYLEYTFTSGGSYYLGVSGYRNSSYSATSGTGDTNGSTGDYTLTVQPLSSGTIDPPIAQFDTENNNSISRANFIGRFSRGYTSRTFYGSTGAGSDTEDWISFRITGRTTGTIQISGMYQDLDLRLYNSSGSLIQSSTNSGTRTDTLNLNGLSAGIYSLRVYPGVLGARSAYAMRFGLNVG